MAAILISMEMAEHLSNIAAKGGRATLKKYGVEQMKKWGKLGGRPKKKKRVMSHSGSFTKSK